MLVEPSSGLEQGSPKASLLGLPPARRGLQTSVLLESSISRSRFSLRVKLSQPVYLSRSFALWLLVYGKQRFLTGETKDGLSYNFELSHGRPKPAFKAIHDDNERRNATT